MFHFSPLHFNGLSWMDHPELVRAAVKNYHQLWYAVSKDESEFLDH